MDTKKTEEFYIKLKSQLENTSTWPSIYLYKFIVPTDVDNTGAVIETKKSKRGTYTSLSVTVNLKNADAIIKKYKEVGEVEGVISL